MTSERENNLQFTDEKEKILSKSGDIKQLLAQTYWANTRDIETIERSIRNSNCYAVLNLTENKIIGFARTVTDSATMFYLCDVVIDTKYRGQGIGKKLVEWVVQSESKDGQKYGLLVTKDAQGLYEKYGFKQFQGYCMSTKKQ